MSEDARGSPPPRSGRTALLYDDDCPFCRWCLGWIMRWDRRGELRPVAIRSREGERLLAELDPEARLRSWHLVEADGRIISGSTAADPLARMLPGGRPLGFLFRTFPGLTERAYGWVDEHRGVLGRALKRMRLLSMLLAGLVLSGCAGGGGEAGGPLTVYVSAPLRGDNAEHGRAIAEGARLALDDAGGAAGDAEVRLEVLDASGPEGWTPEVVAENARTASQDTSAIAYVGDFESGATRTSLPITNEAVLPQVSPASGASDLTRPSPESNDVPELVQPSGERTFVRVIPDDLVQAEAGAAWARQLGARRVAVVSDGSEFGERMAAEFAEEAPGQDLAVTVEETLQGAAASRDLCRSDLVYLAGESPELSLGSSAMDPSCKPTLLGTDALFGETGTLRLTSAAQDPTQLPGQEFVDDYRARYGGQPDRYAAYGYEAMALVLDAIERAGAEGEDRSAVVEELLDTTDRESVLGTYSIDSAGDTTLDALAGYRVEGGAPVFDRALTAP